MTVPKTVSEIFPSKWIHASDLEGKAITVTITAAAVEEVRQKGGRQEWRPVLSVKGTERRLILNKTQALAMADLAGTEVVDAWQGLVVQIAPAVAQNGKPTISIQRPPRLARQATPAPAAPKPAAATNGNNGAPKEIAEHMADDPGCPVDEHGEVVYPSQPAPTEAALALYAPAKPANGQVPGVIAAGETSIPPELAAPMTGRKLVDLLNGRGKHFDNPFHFQEAWKKEHDGEWPGWPKSADLARWAMLYRFGMQHEHGQTKVAA